MGWNDSTGTLQLERLHMLCDAELPCAGEEVPVKGVQGERDPEENG